MKVKTEKKEKKFDAVKVIRAIKEDVSKDIADLNYEQLKAYLENNRI